MFKKFLEWTSGWKTLVFNVLAAILPILTLVEVREVIPVEWLPWYAVAVAVGNIVLRHLTDSKAGWATEEPEAKDLDA